MSGGRFGGSDFWTDDRVALLKQLWTKGDRASVIARKLNCGFTRCAVLGKVHRLRLVARRSGSSASEAKHMGPWKKPKSSAPRRVYTPRPPTKVAERPAPLESAPVTLLARQPHQCCWPLGETNGPDTIFCGAPKAGEHSYCGFHNAVARGAGGWERPDVSLRLVKQGRANVTTLAVLETREVPFE